MSAWINFNGQLLDGSTPLFTAGSRAFRYGDGLFETMRCENEVLLLADYHFERLFSGMQALSIRLDRQVTPEKLQAEILRLLHRNKISGAARIRLSVFRGEGGVFETDGPGSGYLIQAWPISLVRELNENGLVLGLFDNARKTADGISTYKTNNYLVYALAALCARRNQWNEALVLNQHGRVCDGTIANIFWIENDRLFTPPLSEGGIGGVMRRNLLETLPGRGFHVTEEPCLPGRLEKADEIFLTNAISGIRWVRMLSDTTYDNARTREIFDATF